MLTLDSLTKQQLDRSSISASRMFDSRWAALDKAQTNIKNKLSDLYDEIRMLQSIINKLSGDVVVTADDFGKALEDNGINKDDILTEIADIITAAAEETEAIVEEIDTTISCIDYCQTEDNPYECGPDHATYPDEGCNLTDEPCGESGEASECDDSGCPTDWNPDECNHEPICDDTPACAESSPVVPDEPDDEDDDGCFFGCDADDGNCINYDECQTGDSIRDCDAANMTDPTCVYTSQTDDPEVIQNDPICVKCDGGAQSECGTADSQVGCDSFNSSGDCTQYNDTGNCDTNNNVGDCASVNSTGECTISNNNYGCIADNSKGDCESANTNGNCDMGNDTGNCETHNASGDCEHRNDSGDCDVANSAGNCDGQNTSGDCNANNKEGEEIQTCKLINKEGTNCNTRNEAGDCSSNNKTGNCTSDNAAGDCNFSNDTGNCGSYNTGGGNCTNENKSGDCWEYNSEGNCSKNDGDCQMTNDAGDCQSDNNAGNCYLDNTAGDCEVANGTGDCVIQNSQGDCSSKNTAGDCIHDNSVGNCDTQSCEEGQDCGAGQKVEECPECVTEQLSCASGCYDTEVSSCVVCVCGEYTSVDGDGVCDAGWFACGPDYSSCGDTSQCGPSFDAVSGEGDLTPFPCGLCHGIVVDPCGNCYGTGDSSCGQCSPCVGTSNSGGTEGCTDDRGGSSCTDTPSAGCDPCRGGAYTCGESGCSGQANCGSWQSSGCGTCISGQGGCGACINGEGCGTGESSCEYTPPCDYTAPCEFTPCCDSRLCNHGGCAQSVPCISCYGYEGQ